MHVFMSALPGPWLRGAGAGSLPRAVQPVRGGAGQTRVRVGDHPNRMYEN